MGFQGFRVYCLKRPATSLDPIYPKKIIPEEGGVGSDLLRALWDQVWFIDCHEKLIQNGNKTVDCYIVDTDATTASPGPNFEIAVKKKWRKCMCVFSPSSDGAIQSLIFHQDTACWELTIIFILRIRVNNDGKEAAGRWGAERKVLCPCT